MRTLASTRRLYILPLFSVASLYFFPAAVLAVTASRANDFLNSIGVCTHMAQGADIPANVGNMMAYTGIRNIREEPANSHVSIADMLAIHNKAGTRFVLVQSGPNDASINTFITQSKQLQGGGALLALEGPNEPNNWAVTYQGQTSVWNSNFLPVANWQKNFYIQVKADSILKNYPVFHSSEAGGSEPNNVGLQFLTIPSGAGTLMPDGTQYADYANVHNYMTHPSWPGLHDNQTWLAASPGTDCPVDGLYGEYGNTWRNHYTGYTTTQLLTLPRVTTETGWSTNSIGDTQQGKYYLSVYLDQFKRGWSYTFIYMLKDDPVQGTYGLYHTDYTPKQSATNLHNLTTILADTSSNFTPGQVNYAIPNQPGTVHDLLLQKSNGTFELVVWDEKVSGSDNITVNLGATYPTVNIYDPTVGTTATQVLANVSSVPLTLSDHPMILEFSAVPEPATVGLLSALAVIAGTSRRRLS